MRQPTEQDIVKALEAHNECMKLWPNEHDMDQDYLFQEIVAVEIKEVDFIRGFPEPCLWLTFIDGTYTVYRYV